MDLACLSKDWNSTARSAYLGWLYLRQLEFELELLWSFSPLKQSDPGSYTDAWKKIREVKGRYWMILNVENPMVIINDQGQTRMVPFRQIAIRETRLSWWPTDQSIQNKMR